MDDNVFNNIKVRESDVEWEEEYRMDDGRYVLIADREVEIVGNDDIPSRVEPSGMAESLDEDAEIINTY